MIQRDPEKCTECLLCVEDCIAGVFRNMEGVPHVKAPELCNRCSHCVAVCPTRALTHQALDMDQVRPVKKKKIDPEALAEIVRTRRSVRRYKDRPVSAETVEEILDLARFAPTGSNAQDLAYIVVTDKNRLSAISRSLFTFGLSMYNKTKTPPGRAVTAVLDRVFPDNALARYGRGMEYYRQQAEAGRDFILHGAPVLILITAPARSPFGSDNANISGAVITHHAHALGLGTCYIGFLTLALKFSRSLRRLVELPRGRKVFCSLVLGHPAYGPSFTVSRKPAPVTWVGPRDTG